MKLSVTTTGTLVERDRPALGRLVNHIRFTVQSAATMHRLEQELMQEMAAVSESERAADPEFRRDALERAIRRVWGATQ